MATFLCTFKFVVAKPFFPLTFILYIYQSKIMSEWKPIHIHIENHFNRDTQFPQPIWPWKWACGGRNWSIQTCLILGWLVVRGGVLTNWFWLLWSIDLGMESKQMFSTLWDAEPKTRGFVPFPITILSWVFTGWLDRLPSIWDTCFEQAFCNLGGWLSRTKVIAKHDEQSSSWYIFQSMEDLRSEHKRVPLPAWVLSKLCKLCFLEG